jgi:hypothetical protein
MGREETSDDSWNIITTTLQLNFSSLLTTLLTVQKQQTTRSIFVTIQQPALGIATDQFILFLLSYETHVHQHCIQRTKEQWH